MKISPFVNTPPFKLEQLFGSKTRARLLAVFMQDPTKPFFVRELTRRIDAQLNSVRRELKNLVELGIVSERLEMAPGTKSKSLADNKKFYSANTDFILYEDLRTLFKKVQILLKQNLVQEIDEHGTIDFMAFTGRFIGNKDVPTDVLIVGAIDQAALQKIVAMFETELGHEVNYTLMTSEEFQYRRQVADRFLLSILDGERIVMVNRLKV